MIFVFVCNNSGYGYFWSQLLLWLLRPMPVTVNVFTVNYHKNQFAEHSSVHNLVHTKRNRGWWCLMALTHRLVIIKMMMMMTPDWCRANCCWWRWVTHKYKVIQHSSWTDKEQKVLIYNAKLNPQTDRWIGWSDKMDVLNLLIIVWTGRQAGEWSFFHKQTEWMEWWWYGMVWIGFAQTIIMAPLRWWSEW